MEAGDIFLVRGQGKFSTILSSAQKAFYKNARSSHILIALAEGSFIHATSDGGVDIIFFEYLLPSIDDDWRAIRLKNLTEEQRDEIRKAAIFYFEQGYNYKYLLKGNDHSSFCSELAAKIYHKAGVTILDGKQSNKTIPADFDREADAQVNWIDITNEIKDFIQEMESSIKDYRLGFSIMMTGIKKRQMMLQMNRELFKGMKLLSENGGISKEFYEKAQAMEDDFLKNKNISFWDEDI